MKQKCKFCGDLVNLDLEGTQYKDGSASHEHCEDGHNFRCANVQDEDGGDE